MRLSKLCGTLVALASLAGCTSIPHVTPPLPDKQASIDKVTKDWDEPSVVREGKPMIVLITPATPPKHIRDKKISVELESGATVKDIVAVLAELGYSIVLADKEAGDKDYWIPKYTGTLGGLINTIQKATDVFFLWDDGTLVVTSKETVSVGIPQDKEVVDKIAAGLRDLGITGLASSVEAGFVSFDVKQSQLKQVKKFLDRITKNAALVTLQIGVVTVDLSRDLNRGVDWASLNAIIGSSARDLLTGAKTTNVAGSATPTLTTTTTGTTTTTAATAPSKSFLQLSNSTLKGVLLSNAFSLSGVINALDKFGETDTLQNVMLKTITGKEVELVSKTQIPYVSGMGISNIPTGTQSNVTTPTAQSQVNNAYMNQVRTSTANDGLTLKMTPMYDAQAETITVEMKLTIQSVLNFNNLSAGQQGQMSQPTTGERSFNDTIRVRPGQTVIVGGVIYDSLTDGRAGLAGFTQNGGASQNLSVKRQEMFIVLRPTVTAFGALDEQESDELFPRSTAVEKKVPKKVVKAVSADGKDAQ